MPFPTPPVRLETSAAGLSNARRGSLPEEGAIDVIQVEDLVKRFGALTAVDHVSFTVRRGEVFGFLGPNGAGKSTTISILCTLERPTAGRVRVNGFDAVSQPDRVRASIGLVFQDPSLDVQLTALENLDFHAYLYNVPRGVARAREERLLRMVELWDRRNELVRHFSGGMRRRLEVTRGLLHRPAVLFLDEPTLGLDPQTRGLIWRYVLDWRESEGLTVFLTTHYLDEAEHCDRIAIIDRGRIIALDTPRNLKARVGEDVILLRTADNPRAAAEVRARYGRAAAVQGEVVRIVAPQGDMLLPRLCRELSVPVQTADLSRPTLDDVFLTLTGRSIREEGAAIGGPHGR
ncbi:MAG: ATP-binding cassette domain-containing protein [Chloroflexi bacterium]|nr:ATP-binding cassette domain-containing protein [Chloroflexota bacterium]